MENNLDKEISDLLKVISGNSQLSNLPEPPPIMDAEASLWYHKKLITCACCNKQDTINNYTVIDTGYIKALDGCCNLCLKGAGAESTCPIVCLQCKQVILRLEPYVDNDGFKFKSRHAYHVDTCPKCSEDLESSMVIEKKLYLKERYK